MPEDNTPMTPTMPPVDDSQAYSAMSPSASDATSVSGSSDNTNYSDNTDALNASDTLPDVPDVSNIPDVPNVPNVPEYNDYDATNPAAQAAPAVVPPMADEIENNPIVEPDVISANTVTENNDTGVAGQGGNIYAELISKIQGAKNILIALSSNPSVDEMAAAIGLSLYLDKLGKRATAIYSGVTPNALEFLKPEETFEPTADVLQDFVIALNKEKADHLRYKLDGEFVKIYITPYRTKIADSDLDFSYGDFNVDLVLALDVANGVDLDSALREHGRIMHDAVIVNISTSKPGKFGEIEWSDGSASSVSEMIAKLLYSTEGDVKIGKEEATAFLTGIVAATNRFSNASTTPETMQLASRLMGSGANQQLVSKNITPDVENEMMTLYPEKKNTGDQNDPTKLNIDHDGDKKLVDSKKEVEADIADKGSTLLDDLKIAEANLAQAGAEAISEPDSEPMKIDTNDENGELAKPTEVAEKIDEVKPVEQPATEIEEPTVAKTEEPVVMKTEEPTVASEYSMNDSAVVPGATPIDTKEQQVLNDQQEKVVQPEADFDSNEEEASEGDKYGHMLEDALGDINGNTVEENPAVASAPSVPSAPEINGVPEMNYAAVSNEGILPPPPAPPVDMMGNMPSVQATDGTQGTVTLPEVQPIEPVVPAAEPTLTSLGSQPAMQDQVYNSQAADPGAFKIPGAQ